MSKITNWNRSFFCGKSMSTPNYRNRHELLPSIKGLKKPRVLPNHIENPFTTTRFVGCHQPIIIKYEHFSSAPVLDGTQLMEPLFHRTNLHWNLISIEAKPLHPLFPPSISIPNYISFPFCASFSTRFELHFRECGEVISIEMSFLASCKLIHSGTLLVWHFWFVFKLVFFFRNLKHSLSNLHS